jgi:phosphoserine phosphatase
LPTLAPLPLVVDLDGTLIYDDLLWLSIEVLARSKPWRILQLPLWLFRSKTGFKHVLGEAAGWPIDVAKLRYRPALVAWLREERARGRTLVLATASPQIYAERVGAHIGLFDACLGSRIDLNLGGENKARVLLARFGAGKFVYAGDSAKDIPVWNCAAAAVPVGVARRLSVYIERNFTIERSFD